MLENLKRSIDEEFFGCGLFIHLKKVFDIVNHSILQKLEHCGIRSIVNYWFHSFLCKRFQCVSVNGHISKYQPITCGVPQGSVLEPLLFLLYINDLPNSSEKLLFHLVADDSNIYFFSKDLDLIQSTVNNELKYVSQWLRANRLALSIEKTNYVIFHSLKKKAS